MWQAFKELHNINSLSLHSSLICVNLNFDETNAFFSQHTVQRYSELLQRPPVKQHIAYLKGAFLLWLASSRCLQLWKCLLRPTTDSFTKSFGTWSPRFSESQTKTLEIPDTKSISICPHQTSLLLGILIKGQSWKERRNQTCALEQGDKRISLWFNNPGTKLTTLHLLKNGKMPQLTFHVIKQWGAEFQITWLQNPSSLCTALKMALLVIRALPLYSYVKSQQSHISE